MREGGKEMKEEEGREEESGGREEIRSGYAGERSMSDGGRIWQLVRH